MYWEAPTCVICLSELSTNLTVTPCGHVFHLQCMETCLFNKCKNCPLCRNRVLPSKLTNISFALIPAKTATPAISGLSEEEMKDLQALQNKTREAVKEKEALELKIDLTEKYLIEKEAQIKWFQEKYEEETSKTKNFKRRYEETLAQLQSFQYESEKYQGLFNNAHKKLKEAENKLMQLENVSKLIDELENTQTTVTWANLAKEKLSAEEQAANFYNALLITTSSMKNLEKEMKELKELNNNTAQQFSSTKRQLLMVRKENENLTKQMTTLETQLNTSSLKRKAEDMPAILVENEMNFQPMCRPKKTLSLLQSRQ